MKSFLLSHSELDHLLDSGDPVAITETLLLSPYEDEMAEAMSRYQGADAVEDAVSRNLVKTFGKLRRVCRGELYHLAAIFLSRWDLQGVKSLLRNRHHELDAGTGERSLVLCPSMPVAVQQSLSDADSMDTLIRGLVAWNARLCGSLTEAMAKYQESRNLRVLEDALDKSYFVDNIWRLERERSANAVFVRNLLRYEIDRINLRRLFEPRPAGVEAEELVAELLPKGTLSPQTLRDIALAGSASRGAELLESTGYGDMAGALTSFSQTGKFSLLERKFELAFLDRLRQAAQSNSMGLAVLMRYAWLKYNEVMNVRMIARGLSVHLPKTRIEEEVLHV
jgi:vacuolar-type H+-ATPase subunit C/Vma6